MVKAFCTPISGQGGSLWTLTQKSTFPNEFGGEMQVTDKAKKNKSHVSKLPRAFVFRCAFDSAKFKVWIFFACLIFFFQCFMNLLVKIYKKRYGRPNETLWTTDFFNSVFGLVSVCILFIQKQVPYFKAVIDSNLTRLLLRKKKKKHVKKTAFRSGLPICHELWDIGFIFFSLK